MDKIPRRYIKVANYEEIEKRAFVAGAAKLLAKPLLGVFKAKSLPGLIGKGVEAKFYLGALKGVPKAMKAKGSPFATKL